MQKIQWKNSQLMEKQDWKFQSISARQYFQMIGTYKVFKGCPNKFWMKSFFSENLKSAKISFFVKKKLVNLKGDLHWIATIKTNFHEFFAFCKIFVIFG